MIPKYLFLVFLLIVLLVGCSSHEPLPTLDFSTEVPVDPSVVSTTVPEVSSAETPVSSEITMAPTSGSAVGATLEVEASPELPSGDDVLYGLIAASSGVETGSYEMSVASDVQVEGLGVPVSMKIFGDYQEPDRQQVTAEVGVSFLKIQIEMVIIGDTVYVKDPLTDVWTVEEGSSGTGGFREFLDLIQPSELVGRLVLVGNSLVDGRMVFHLEGEVPPEVLGEAGEGIESLWVRYSIGSRDHLMYGSEIRMTDDEGSSTTVAFRFFDYGKELDIQAPEIGLVRPPLNFDGSECDTTLRQQLVFQRGASRAVHVNEIVAQLHATRSECPAAFWNPEAETSITNTDATGDTWAGGVADECFGVSPGAVADMQVGDQKVPRGLRVQNDDSKTPRTSTGRDSDNNIIVYWSTTAANRPSDGATCWLYVNRLRTWAENY